MATIAEQLTSLANTKTAIKDAIVAKGVTVADTDPFSAYASKIGEISGGGAATKFGANVDAWIGDVDENGILGEPTAETHLDFTGVKYIYINALEYAFYGRKTIASVNLSSLITVETYGLYYTFYGCTGITGVNLSSLQTVFGYGMPSAFYGCTGITSVDLSSLQSIDPNGMASAFYGCTGIATVDLSSLQNIGTSGMASAFYGCTGLVSADLSSLQSIGTSGMSAAFYRCTGITTVNLSSLQSIGSNGMASAFQQCAFTTISFPSLTSVQTSSFGTTASNSAFRDCTALTEIHFRADMQATIEAMSQYADKWGATNATIYFDLIGTITVNGVAYARNEPNSIRVDETKTYVAWADESGNIVYTDATAEPAVDTPVYSDNGTTQVGTVSAVA